MMVWLRHEKAGVAVGTEVSRWVRLVAGASWLDVENLNWRESLRV
jgi:hypothetical protein